MTTGKGHQVQYGAKFVSVRIPKSPVSMDQSAKDARDTSDHKCILIRNPAYKYDKHYKFLKSEGLVGAVPAQRLPQKLHDRSPFKPAVHSL